MEHKQHKRFLRVFIFTGVILILATGAINLIIDPFGMFNIVVIPGINEQKPGFNTHVRQSKAHAIRMIKPRGLILGSSRAEYGLDPEHPAWPQGARPVYNLALPSGSIHEALRYLQHSHALQPVKQVVLALDMFMFNTRFQIQADFTDSRLASKDENIPSIGWLHDLFTSLFSIDALRASLSTITSQGDKTHVPYLPNGMRHESLNWNKILHKGGHHKAFLNNERYSLTAPDGWALFTLNGNTGNSYPTMETFRKLVVFCRRESIDLRIIISPVHARKLEVISQLGLWPLFEFWKHELVSILAADSIRHPRLAPIPLWDFSGYSAITMESLPLLEEKHARMQWYWEGSHYKKEVGDIILDRVLQQKSNTHVYIPYFSVELSKDNIENHLSYSRKARHNYGVTHPEEVKEITEMIRETITHREKLMGKLK